MSSIKPTTNETTQSHVESWILGGVLILGAGLLGAFGYIIFRFLPIGQSIASLFSWLFANNTVHTTWYITRAAGWIAYFLLWFSMVWGLVIPTKLFERVLSPTFAVDFHEYLSLLSIGFVILHVTVLLFDQYLPFTLAQILVPFLSTYRPLWIGLGVIGAYLSALVTVTFYLRKKIGQKRFKAIHTLSVFGYLGVILHAFFAGSDSSLPIVQLIYFGTFIVVVFLTAFWLLRGRQLRQEKDEHERSARLAAMHRPTHPVRR
jgi:sulfoxide reductase heme-binding subunit YedZ